MNRLLILIVLIALLITTVVFADVKKCEDCPVNKPCGYSHPAGDGCNTCSGSTWCNEGKWYTNGTNWCTLLSCQKGYEIPNPFGEKQREVK